MRHEICVSSRREEERRQKIAEEEQREREARASHFHSKSLEFDLRFLAYFFVDTQVSSVIFVSKSIQSLCF